MDEVGSNTVSADPEVQIVPEIPVDDATTLPVLPVKPEDSPEV